MSDTFFRLDDKTAVVTGGGQGIGAAIARRLAAAGATVVLFDLHKDPATKLAAEIGGSVIQGDVTSEAAIAAATARRHR